MKDSGIEWIGEIPSGWTVESSKGIFVARREHARKDDVMLTASQRFGMIPQERYDDVVSYKTVKVIKDEGILKHVEPGDFVISMRSFQGGLEYSEYRGKMSSAYLALYPRHGWPISDGYYRYLFKSHRYIQSLQRTSNLVRDGQALRYANFIQVPIPYPPPCEQQRIADYLDERCAAIDEVGHTIEDEIEALRRLRKATIHRAVTKGLDEGVPMRDSGYHYIGNICKDWQLVRFRYLCDIDTGDHDTQDKEPDGEYPMYVRSPNVERSNTYTFDCEGILMAGDGAGAGRVFHHANGRYAVHQRVYCFHNFQQRIVTDYLYYYLSEHFGYRMDMGSAQSTVPSVRLHMIQDFPVPLPDCDLQQRIADYLDERCAAIDSVIDTRTRQLERLEDYRKALVFAYVTGKKEVPTHA